MGEVVTGRLWQEKEIAGLGVRDSRARVDSVHVALAAGHIRSRIPLLSIQLRRLSVSTFPHRVPHFQVGFAPATVTIVAPTRIVLVAGVCATLEAAAILAGRAELASAEVERAPVRPLIRAHDLEFVDIATAVPAVSSRAENLRAP